MIASRDIDLGPAVAIGVAAILFLAIPGLIAGNRKHASANAIGICGLCGGCFPPCWLVALIWAFTGPNNRTVKAKPAAFPVQAVQTIPQRKVIMLSCSMCSYCFEVGGDLGPIAHCPKCGATTANPYATSKSAKETRPVAVPVAVEECVIVHCSGCGKKVKFKDGRDRGRCPSCGCINSIKRA